MSSFYHSLFIALYILGTSASFQNDESGSDQLSTPTTEEKKNEPFLPVDKEWQIEMCKKLKFEWVEPCIQENHEYFLGIPNKLVKIRKDGNCFFSSLSYWISGTTKYGQILRKNIIDFAKTSEIYKTMTFDDERDERIEKMYRSVEFAESPKIFAAADYLKTSICVYSDDSFLKGWHFFAANNLLNTKEDEKCLYIINHGEHYDVVVDTFPIGTEPLDDTEIKKDDGTIVDDTILFDSEDSDEFLNAECSSAFVNPFASSTEIIKPEDDGIVDVNILTLFFSYHINNTSVVLFKNN
ncbi:uncharacterized protein LOC126895268 isoform X4 [Daktulosphaira vitifoliae]|uniref:uncharacterized protein LOC126895268 isoform X4 n=1 Tax=Daktulosphaira vitifoliae TaxID=58002 RepID=UPI0021A97E36|nr:uncharacterized protein LOC126895268 isoform X4 [Daktulosphaira vitifoliae]